ncbi:hypothetical protein ABL78_7781 [Leptomonas seymouri]|uniref:Uncharacterized protein n=1 Tax=Leptomonas seymouri TaxID=5684 RepID=A0A0N1PC30_LEPSE|nr:hypothetical protein ABL78_7781 [Leptomonas seymouri]|eukprot:KPI83193.1 hypothetical protein ABL78_7781 [Leptomonas seymouri]
MSASADVLPLSVVMELPSTAPDGPAAITSPHTPQSTPPNSANRLLLRPLPQRRRSNLQQTSRKLIGQHISSPPTPSSAPAKHYEEEEAERSDTSESGGRSPAQSRAKTATSVEECGSTVPANIEAACTAIVATTTVAATPPAMATCYPAEQIDGSARTEPPSIPTFHCPPICSAVAGKLSSGATQPNLRRISPSQPMPRFTPCFDASSTFLSYASNLSSSALANSSVSSSFAGISPLSRQGNPLEPTAEPKLSSPSTALADTGRGAGLNGRPAPPLLRSSFFSHTLSDDANLSSASSYAGRTSMNGSVNGSPRLRVGPTPPRIPNNTIRVASGGATPPSSNRSGARVSLLRIGVPSSTVSPKVATGPLDVSHQVKENGNGSTMRAVGGLVPTSPQGVRRLEPSARRTTFDRSGSTASLSEGLSPTLKTGAGKDGGEGGLGGHCGTGESAPAVAGRVEPTLTKEMRNFVLGQYRTLQREVLALPTVAEKSRDPSQADVSAAGFVHVRRCSCPLHSKSAKRAAERLQEEERLRILQQKHHDMEIIRNGGRERVGANMKSSAMLAGSLSKMRSRHRLSTQSNNAGHISSSLDRTIDAAFASEDSPFGSSVEVDGVALYGTGSFGCSSLKVLAQQPGASEAAKRQGEVDAAPAETTEAAAKAGETEAWCSSKFFMEARTAPFSVASQGPDRRGSRSVNKNRMKGEAIVVAVVPDSDEDEESEGEVRWDTPLQRTKGDTEGGRPGFSSTSWRMATPSQPKSLTASVSATCPAKRAGERLPTQNGSHTPQCHSPSSPSAPLLMNNSRGSIDGGSSSDDDACFSFNKLRSQRLRSTASPCSSQLVDPKDLSATQPLTPPKPSDHSPDRVKRRFRSLLSLSNEPLPDVSVDEGGEGGDNACCFCCPCKKPENFFMLCRASKQNGSFVVAHEPASVCPYREKDSLSHGAAASTGLPPPIHKEDADAGSECRVVFEDLEAVGGDDEPLLSMQSFRRTSIQRIR